MTSVRRTVSVASALVASQAVLCAVIGWVTFAGHGPVHTTAEPDLGPALVVPPATVAPVRTSKPDRPQARPAEAPVPTSSAPSSAPPSAAILLGGSAPPENSPAAPSPDADMTTPPATQAMPAVTDSPSDTDARVTPGPTITEVVGDVTVGDECDREDAAGRTPADVLVRCLRNRAGILVWQIV